MSKRKQKIILEGFTVSVGKLIIEHESEHLDGDALSANVRDAIGQVISAPARLLVAESVETTETLGLPASQVADKPRRRRRRTANPALENNGDDSGDRSSRTKPNSARSLIDEINDDGFFAQERTIAEVREELHTRGHSFKSNELSPVLLAMTKQKVLSRKKDDKGSWVYRAK